MVGGRERKYTQEFIDKIKALKLAGKTGHQISLELGIAERTMYKLLEKKRGVKKPKPIEFEGLKVYNLQDTASILQLSVRTLRQYIKDNKLEAKKIGRAYYVTSKAIKELLK